MGVKPQNGINVDFNLEKFLYFGAGIVFGIVFKIYLDNRKRKIDFYADTYKDIWGVIQNVTGVINRKRIVDHDKVMERIHSKYSCKDINSFLQNCPNLDDPKLEELLHKFSENLSSYQSEKGRLQFSSMGDGQVNYKEIANDLSRRIKKRINRYLSNITI